MYAISMPHISPLSLDLYGRIDFLKGGRYGPKNCLAWRGAFKGIAGNHYAHIMFKRRGYRVTRAVLERKLGRSLGPNMWALHTCDDCRCIAEEHLYEGTPKQNTADMRARGRHFDNRGEKHPNAKLTYKIAADIRRLRGVMSHRKIAAQFGVSPGAVASVIYGKTWREHNGTERVHPAGAGVE